MKNISLQSKNFKGKIVGGATYFHKSALHLLGTTHQKMIKTAVELNRNKQKWNVVKFHKQFCNKLSFLDYQSFSDFEFPCLKFSYQTDLEYLTFKSRKHSNINPPILHRKELLMDPSHPNFIKFCNLTKTLEKLGAFENITKLGTKLRWEDELSRLFILIKNHEAQIIENKLNAS